ncbi:MAG: hypothetical protein DBY45_10015 [Clostridiales bacterium]|nr:MAG: hypothetical protein DBY45_10015 [Clostridiales bacterium]
MKSWSRGTLYATIVSSDDERKGILTKRSTKGFTLVEIIVVLAIAAIFTAVTILSITDFVDRRPERPLHCLYSGCNQTLLW